MQLASRFASHSPTLRSDYPLSDEQIRRVASSIFADAPHESRSERYAYIPPAAVLAELRKEGFEPFMAAQTRVRHEDRREYTKHMLRLRHASQINGAEANEIVLLNSHDGTSYQMLAGRGLYRDALDPVGRYGTFDQRMFAQGFEPLRRLTRIKLLLAAIFAEIGEVPSGGWMNGVLTSSKRRGVLVMVYPQRLINIP